MIQNLSLHYQAPKSTKSTELDFSYNTSSISVSDNETTISETDNGVSLSKTDNESLSESDANSNTLALQSYPKCSVASPEILTQGEIPINNYKTIELYNDVSGLQAEEQPVSYSSHNSAEAHSPTDRVLLPQHLQEWRNSGIADEIIKQNIYSITGSAAVTSLLNIGECPAWRLQQLQKTVFGGGWVCGRRMKPDMPRVIRDKPIKYESPIGGGCEPIKLELPEELWQKIALKFGVAKPPEIDGWKWVEQNPKIDVAIAEGEKKAGCVMSQTLTPCLALPGHTAAFKKDGGDVRFKEFLHPDRKIILCFDKDPQENAAQAVARTVKGIGFRLNPKKQKALAQLFICRWWTPEKGVDDLWANQGQVAVEDVITNAIPWKKWVDTSHNLLGVEPDIQFCNHRWKEGLQIPKDKHLVAVLGQKGTGKTWFLEQLCLEAKEEERPSIAVTHRIQLSQALSNRLGLVYISDLDGTVEGAKNLSLCIDSLAKIDLKKFAGGYIIIDEARQVLEHFLTGETCAYKRDKILKFLKALAQVVLETGGKFIIADADLNGETLRFFSGLLGGEEPYIIQNTYREPSYKCYLSNGAVVSVGSSFIKTPADVISVLLTEAAKGKRIFVFVTGQKEDSRWGSINIEGLLLKMGISSIIRIDSETTKNPEHKAFQATGKINELCDSHQITIGTPSLGTGVSIENQKPFDLVIGIFTGVGSPDAARQALMRVRDKNVPRLIYVADRGLDTHFSNLGRTKETVGTRLKELQDFQEISLKRHDAEVLEEYPEIKHCNLASTYYENHIASRNKENAAFKNYVRWGLQEENVQVIDIKVASEIYETEHDFQKVYDEIGAIKEEHVIEYRTRLEAQEKLEKEEYAKLKGATEQTESERLALEATVLSNRYGGIPVTQDLIEKDSNNWFKVIKLHYACSTGYAIQRDIQLLKANSQIKKGEGQVIQHDFIERQKLLVQAEFILNSKIVDLINNQHIFSNADEETIELFKYLVDHISDINLLFNEKLKPTQYKADKFNFKLIETVAQLIGARSKCIGQPRIKGKQVRQYQLKFIEDGRETVFDAWRIRDLETQAKWFERKREWETKKLLMHIDDEISVEEFLKLKEHTLFDAAWEKTYTSTRIKIINRADNFQLPKPEKIQLDPTNQDYQKHLSEIATWDKFAIDCETYGDDPKNKEGLHPRKGQIRLIQISNGKKVFWVDLGGRNSDKAAVHDSLKDCLQLLNKLISDPNVLTINHNIHFDLRFLRFQLGFDRAKNVVDTMKGAQNFFGDYGGLKVLPGGYGLGNLCEKLLGLTVDKSEQKSDWGAELSQSQINYATDDPFVTYHLYDRIEELYQNPAKFGFGKLVQAGIKDAWKLENDVIPCAVEIEANGVPIDRTEANNLLTRCKVIQTQLLTKWQDLVPELNYTQNKKLKSFLNEKYNLQIQKLDKAKIAELNNLEEIKLLSKLRAIKIPIQQLESLLRSSVQTGRIQTVFKTLTGTGRFSSGNSKQFNDLPNLQSISAKAHPALKEFGLPGLRTVVKPTGEITHTIAEKKLTNRTLAVIDLAGAHGRIAADVANDETAIAGNNDESIDNHSKVAVHVAKALNQAVTWQDIKKGAKSGNAEFKLFRDAAKNTYYGWLNGAGAKRIQEQIKSNSGQIVALEACEGAIKGCEALYPQVVEFRQKLIAELSNKDNLLYVDGKYYAVNKIESVNNRITHLVTVDDDEIDLPYTQCLAAIWSRTEATALKRALVLITELADTRTEWGLKVVNYVHDEINIEFNTAFAEEAITTVNNIIGDCFQATMQRVSDGRETDWTKLVVENWSQK